MRLFITEIRRFWSRRITWITILVTCLLMVIGIGIAFGVQLASEEVAEGTATVDDFCVDSGMLAREDGDPYYEGMTDEQILDECTFVAGGPYPVTDLVGYTYSELGSEVTWDRYREQVQESPKLTVAGKEYREPASGFDGVLPTIAGFFFVVAAVLGGSFVGAEYRAGTVENLLLWEPRRLRVIGAKYAAGFVSSFAAVLGVLTFFTGLFLFDAGFHGNFEPATNRFWVDLILVLARSAAIAGLFFILAMAIANIARNTTAAVSALLGWFVISNILIALISQWIQLGHYELFNNANAFIRLADVSRWLGPNFNENTVASHGPWMAVAVVAVWTLVPASLAGLLFWRRDIS